MSASRHWVALDGTMRRLLPERGMVQARRRFAHRAAALTDIYLAHIQKTMAGPATDTADVAPYLDLLRLTHQELTAALGQAWNSDPGSVSS